MMILIIGSCKYFLYLFETLHIVYDDKTKKKWLLK